MTNSLPASFPLHPTSSGPGYETYSRSSPSDNFVYEEDYQDLDDEVINIKTEPTEAPDFDWNDMRGMDHMDHNLPHIKTEVEPYAGMFSSYKICFSWLIFCSFNLDDSLYMLLMILINVLD